MSFSRPIQWYHSHADPIWPDGTVKALHCLYLSSIFFVSIYLTLFYQSCQMMMPTYAMILLPVSASGCLWQVPFCLCLLSAVLPFSVSLFNTCACPFPVFRFCGIQAAQCALHSTLGRFFHQIKVCRWIGRKDSIQAVCRRLRRLEGILYEAAKNFELFLKIQSQNKQT